MKNMIYQLGFLYAFVVFAILNSCKKMIKVAPPVGQLTVKSVYADSATALSALLNTYALFDRTIDLNLNRNIGMYTDEFTFTNTAPEQPLEFLHSVVSPSNYLDLNIWENFYRVIYQSNDLVSHLKNTKAFSVTYAGQLIAEARFLRAFSYFYLINLYGAVPLILTTSVEENRSAFRTDTAAVYNQIVKDLQESQGGLSVTYRGAGIVRANKWAATAMLARVELFLKDWTATEKNASLVINSGLYTPLEAPDKVFLANSHCAILQFWTQNGYIHDAASLLPDGEAKPLNPLTDDLLNSFENNDLRRSTWINAATLDAAGNTHTYYYLYKYHNRTNNTSRPEYLMALRIAEQYLIRAEARAHQGNIPGAQSDLNIIRARAGLPPTKANTPTELLDAIMHERRVELFGEWGTRFFDLKRTGRLNVVMQAYKPGWRKDTTAVLPIPQNEITTDPNLVQNIGY